MPDLRQTIADRLTPHLDELAAHTAFEPFADQLQDLLGGDFQGNTLFALLIEKQAAGALKPCPNLGDRDTHSMRAWNRLVSGGPEALLAYDNRSLTDVLQSPWHTVVFDAAWQLREKEASEEGKRGKSLESLRTGEIRATLEALPDTLVGALDGTWKAWRTVHDVHCNITGERLKVDLRDWEPVLMRFDMDTRNYVEAEAIGARKPLRHMEMDLPTGELLIADWFRIPGFNEGLEQLTKRREFNINADDGADQQTQAYLERAGFVSITVGNTSPTIYRDGEMMRLGWFDEDSLYDEDGEKTREGPEEIGSTCTDLWWVTMADKQVITDLLMRSEKYADRDAAGAAIDAYVEGTYGATRLQVEPGPLHVYAPSGHGADAQDGRFVKAGLPEIEGLDDQIVLSRAPLELDPRMVLETGFKQGDPAPAPEPEGLTT
ncbi:hypothetical protein [Palleronia sp.]|uniref:hypothetical protein n=1 Tax=Palleronia sp. TaxID=1940284 RepID=UPI0035C83540